MEVILLVDDGVAQVFCDRQNPSDADQCHNHGYQHQHYADEQIGCVWCNKADDCCYDKQQGRGQTGGNPADQEVKILSRSPFLCLYVIYLSLGDYAIIYVNVGSYFAALMATGHTRQCLT